MKQEMKPEVKPEVKRGVKLTVKLEMEFTVKLGMTLPDEAFEDPSMKIEEQVCIDVVMWYGFRLRG